MRHQQHGFSLVEVMIAVLVLSIGLLGMAGLQAASVRNTYSAYMRSQAMILANDIADRIRSNPGTAGIDGAAGGDYNAIGPGLASGGSTACDTTVCTPGQLAAYDIAVWSDRVKTTLPGGNGSVTGDGRVFTVTVMWDDDKTGVAGTGCSGNRAVDLTCYQNTFIR